MNTFGEYGTMTNEIKKQDTLKILEKHLAEKHHLTAKTIYAAGVNNYDNLPSKDNSKPVMTPVRRLTLARLAVRSKA